MPTSRKTTVCPWRRRSVSRSIGAPPPRARTPSSSASARALRTLQGPERRLAVLDEDVGDRPTLRGLDGGVGVVQRHAEEPCEEASDGALPRAGWTHEDDSGHQPSSQVRIEGGIAAEVCRVVQSRLGHRVAPNYSRQASARTRATIASATTPAAGTAQTSERWWIARAGSSDATSTVSSARGTVEIGFIAADSEQPPDGHAALGATRAAGPAADDAVGASLHLVVGDRAAPGRRPEPVTDLHRLDRLDAHEGRREARVEPAVPVRASPDRAGGR